MMFLGTWYKWAGGGPDGFDCSGLVMEYLKSVGLVERQVDMTAAQIYERFADRDVPFPYPGCLIFYANKNGDIAHVEIAVHDGSLSIGASGGGPHVTDVASAIRNNAFVKIRPVKRDRKIVAIVDPFKKEL